MHVKLICNDVHSYEYEFKCRRICKYICLRRLSYLMYIIFIKGIRQHKSLCTTKNAHTHFRSEYGRMSDAPAQATTSSNSSTTKPVASGGTKNIVSKGVDLRAGEALIKQTAPSNDYFLVEKMFFQTQSFLNGEICDDVAYPIDETNCNGLIPQKCLNTPNGIPSQFASIVAKPFSCFKKVVMVAFLDQTPVILLRTKCVKVPKLYGLHTTNFESVVWQNVRPLSTKKVCSLHPSFMTYVVYMNATFGGNMPTCPINQLRSRLEKSNEVLICFYPFGEHNDDVSTLLRIPHPDLTPNEIDDQAEAKHMLDKNVPRKMYEMMASFVSIPTPSDSIYGRCKEPKLSANDIMRMTGAEDAIKRAKSTTTNNALANNNNNNRNALPLKHKRDTENDARMQRHMKKNSSNSSRFVKDEASGDDSDDSEDDNSDDNASDSEDGFINDEESESEEEEEDAMSEASQEEKKQKKRKKKSIAQSKKRKRVIKDSDDDESGDNDDDEQSKGSQKTVPNKNLNDYALVNATICSLQEMLCKMKNNTTLSLHTNNKLQGLVDSLQNSIRSNESTASNVVDVMIDMIYCLLGCITSADKEPTSEKLVEFVSKNMTIYRNALSTMDKYREVIKQTTDDMAEFQNNLKESYTSCIEMASGPEQQNQETPPEDATIVSEEQH